MSADVGRWREIGDVMLCHITCHRNAADITNIAIMYTNFKGFGSCSGNPNQKETMLVSQRAVDDPGHGVYCIKNDSQRFNGIKSFLTSLVAARGHHGVTSAKVLVFTENDVLTHLTGATRIDSQCWFQSTSSTCRCYIVCRQGNLYRDRNVSST